MFLYFVFCVCNGAHRDPHLLTPSVPTRRSSDLIRASRSRTECPPAARESNAPSVSGDACIEGLLSGGTISYTDGNHGTTGKTNTKFECTASIRLISGLNRREIIWRRPMRSEEHTSELQSLMHNSYAAFCLKKQTIPQNQKI